MRICPKSPILRGIALAVEHDGWPWERTWGCSYPWPAAGFSERDGSIGTVSIGIERSALLSGFTYCEWTADSHLLLPGLGQTSAGGLV